MIYLKHMKKWVFLFSILIFLLVVSCEKSSSTNSGPFYTNAFAIQNDSNQQFSYTTEKNSPDSLKMKFQARVNYKDTFGNFELLIPLPDTIDTIWLNPTSKYTYSSSDLIGDAYKLDTTAVNFVLFESNSKEFNSSTGIFQAQFIIDSLNGKINILSPDIVLLSNGIFSGTFLE